MKFEKQPHSCIPSACKSYPYSKCDGYTHSYSINDWWAIHTLYMRLKTQKWKEVVQASFLLHFEVEGQFKKVEGRRVSGSSPSKGYRGSKWQKWDRSTNEVECNLVDFLSLLSFKSHIHCDKLVSRRSYKAVPSVTMKQTINCSWNIKTHYLRFKHFIIAITLAKTKFVSSVPSIMSNIFGCSARMVENRSRGNCRRSYIYT
jgi:hypothetical protein